MYSDFARVRYEWIGKISDDELCERLLESGSALCVLNTKKGVRAIYDRIRGEGVFHLSTNMTPEHLGRCIETIRERLNEHKRCIVISTSLIEAGVDVDFPVVFRENAGLDSIIQAGGRCNREGKNPADESVVYIFSRDEDQPRFEAVKSITNRVCELFDNISSPEAIHDYFERLYKTSPYEKKDKLDEKNILGLIGQKDVKKILPYREISDRFRYIDKEQKLVLIPDDKNGELCGAVRSGKLSRKILREITKCSVAVYPYQFDSGSAVCCRMSAAASPCLRISHGMTRTADLLSRRPEREYSGERKGVSKCQNQSDSGYSGTTRCSQDPS